MVDRDKVIKALRACYSADVKWCQARVKGQCDYNVAYCRMALFKDAAELLEAQEPRVMTLEEVKALPDESDVWLEEFCSIVVATTISHQPTIYKVLKRFNPDATYFYGIEHADYNSGEYMDADYGTEWRCWTSRPTGAQREATPWR